MTLDRTQPPALRRDLNIDFPEFEVLRHKHFSLSVFPAKGLEVISLTLFFPRRLPLTPLLHWALPALLVRGTEQYTADELAMALESLGVRLSCHAQKDAYEIRMRCARQNLEPALSLLHEILLTPTYPISEVRQWANSERESFKALLEDPEFLAQQALQPALFGATHPYGLVTSLADFDAFSPSEEAPSAHEPLTSERLSQLWREEILPCGFVAIAAGGLSTEDITLLDNKLTSFPSKPTAAVPVLEMPALPNERLIYTPCPNSAQVAILGGTCFLPRTEPTDDFGLDVALALLGGVFRSRLMLNLREDKGYTYGVRLRLFERQALTFVSIQTTVGKTYAQDALKEIRYEFERLQAEPPTQEEVDGLRTELLVSLMEQFDNPLQAARLLTDFRLPDVDASARMRAKIDTIRTITPENIWRIAQKELFFTNFVWSIAGGDPIDALP